MMSGVKRVFVEKKKPYAVKAKELYEDLKAFDKNVVEGIFDISTLLPAISFILLALILWFWYPLKKKLVDENVEFLRQKHNK